MGELFKALSASFARFVFAWMAPGVLSLGLAWLIVLPVFLPKSDFLDRILAPGSDSPLTAAVIFTFLVIVSSVLFAYAALPVYRLLEGFSLPRGIKKRRIRKYRRQLFRIQRQRERARQRGLEPPAFLQEKLDSYPERLADVRATRLGNSLAAMEVYAIDRYGFDSQRLWYELLGVSSQATRHDTEEGRAPVDFFVSSILHMVFLGVFSLYGALAARTVDPNSPGNYISSAPDIPCLVLASIAFALVPIAYRAAVLNVTDWTAAVKALVNLNRLKLAEELGLKVPTNYADERDMWLSYMEVVERNEKRYIEAYDSHRKQSGAR